MTELTRREFLKHASLGLAATGVAGLVLRAEARPTAPSKNIEISEQVLQQMGEPPLPIVMQDNLNLTQNSQLGPFYRAGAPFRAKVTPPFEPGTVLIVSGRVWAFDTKKPLSGTEVDIGTDWVHSAIPNFIGDEIAIEIDLWTRPPKKKP